MLSREDILKYSSNYNCLSYPPQIYEDLVVNQIDCQKRFEILGAWKGGCLRKHVAGKDFVDSNNDNYSFTQRWNYKAPVSRLAWENLYEMEVNLAKDIPIFFPQEEPTVMKLLKNRKGFGFVLSAFILHSYFPDVYPIYDQHVYRAFQNITQSSNRQIKVASTRWQDYTDYRYFTEMIKQETSLPYWIVDRGLWYYGKMISNRDKVNKQKGSSTQENYTKTSVIWNKLNTLGGKAKEFKWRITYDNTIEIQRAGSIETETIDEQVINKLFKFFIDYKWFPLANSVSKLHDGTENIGVGWYLYNYHGFSETKQQLSSHISSLFVNSELWDYNQKKRNMRFSVLSYEWHKILKDYYE